MARDNVSVLPYGVIFDMDGVLVDSEPFIARAGCLMFAELGLTVRPEDFVPFVGAGEDRYLGGVAEKYRFPIDITSAKRRTYEIYLNIIKGRLAPLPGVHTFLDACRRVGKQTALATSADLVKAEGNLREIGLPLSTFDAVVTGLDVVNKKPHPEIFVTAARRLELDPQDCLVIEDAVNGVAAAKGSGARCLALTTSFTCEQLVGADWYAPTLAEASESVLFWA